MQFLVEDVLCLEQAFSCFVNPISGVFGQAFNKFKVFLRFLNGSGRAVLKMTQFLPPNLLALFAPRDPIPYLPPVAKLPHEKKSRGYLGVGAFLDHFEVSNPFSL